jgi:WD40 repeat protein
MLAATTAAPDAALYLWELQTRAQVRREGHTDSVVALAWRPDSQAVATASDDATLRLWSLDIKQPPRTLPFHTGPQCRVAFTPEGRHLIAANQDGSIFVLRLSAAP